MMNPNELWKQMTDFQKLAFDNTLNAMTQLQTQTEKMMAIFMDQASWFSEKCQTGSETAGKDCGAGSQTGSERAGKDCGTGRDHQTSANVAEKGERPRTGGGQELAEHREGPDRTIAKETGDVVEQKGVTKTDDPPKRFVETGD